MEKVLETVKKGDPKITHSLIKELDTVKMLFSKVNKQNVEQKMLLKGLKPMTFS